MGAKALTIKQNMLWNSAGSIVNLACQWLVTVLVVRLSAGYEDAGVFSLAAAVYGIFAPIAQYRMYTYQVSDVRNENTAGEYLAFRFLTGGAALALCCGYAWLTCSPDALPAILLYGVYKTLTLVIDVFHACDQRHRRMDYIGTSLALQGVATLAVFVGVYLAGGGLVVALAAMCAAIVCVGALYDVPRTRSLERIRAGISRKKAARLLAVCFPAVVAGLAASAMPSIPRQYLSYCMGDSALGVYASVAAPVAIIQMGASYIYNPLLGYFSGSFEQRDRRAFLALLGKSTAGIAAVGAACAVGLAVLGEPLLVLVFGESIRPHAYLLLPLVGLAVATGYLWFLNDLLISLRNFKATLVSSVASLAVVLAAMVPAVGCWGANGVTAAALAATAVGIAVMAAYLAAQVKARWE